MPDVKDLYTITTGSMVAGSAGEQGILVDSALLYTLHAIRKPAYD